MMQRCQKCGGSVLRFSSGEVSCINCSHVVVESALPLVIMQAALPVAVLSRSGWTQAHYVADDEGYDG